MVRAAFRRIKAIDPKNEVVLFKEGLNGLAGRLEVNHLKDQRQAMRGIIRALLLVLVESPNLNPVLALSIPRCGIKKAEITDVAVVNLRQLGLDAIIVIGGEGSFKGLSYIVDASS